MGVGIFVFDCETILDARALLGVLDRDVIDECIRDGELDERLLSQRAMEIYKEKRGTEFLPVCFHKVVSISAVVADEFGSFMRVSTLDASSEKERISQFLNFINKHNPRLISFNGKGFDLPMIMSRAMIYNLSAPAYFEVENREQNKSKWDNYRYKFSDRFHMDLLSEISDYKAVSGLNLNYLCKSMNLPGKYDVSGDDVMGLYYENKIDKIDEYCQSDVLNTYWLFLKYELLRGNILIEDYANHINKMRTYLLQNCQNMSYTEVFAKYIDEELKRLEI